MGRKSKTKREKRKRVYLTTGPVKPRHCPLCTTVLDGATGISLDGPERPQPKAGDVTVCAYCSAVLAFTVDGLRQATAADLTQVDPELLRILFAYSARDHSSRPH